MPKAQDPFVTHALDLEEVWPGAREVLLGDPVFGSLVREVGPVRIPVERPTIFTYLVRSIVYQQLAGKAAATIYGRVREVLAGEVTSEAVLAAEEERLRGAGLSRNKLLAVQDLARRVGEGSLSLEGLEALTDEEVVERLTVVRGIGPWTVRMLLLFHLRRPDVWPVGDLGVRAGWGRLHGLQEPPTAKDLLNAADGYRPWRSAVAWYCWRAVDG